MRKSKLRSDKKEEPVIQLWDTHNACGLIILLKRGALYSNQTGGVMCHHPQERGAFYPTISGDWVPDLGVETQDCFGLSVETANNVDKIFERHFKNWKVRLDRSKRKVCQESWLYVNMWPIKTSASYDDPMGFCIFDGNIPSPVKAVLTWPNSD